MNCLPRSIILFLLPFSTIFKFKKNFLKMLLLFTGATLCQGGKTICSCLRTLGMQGEAAFANYHHILSRNKFSLKDASKILIEMTLPLINQSQVILVIDEHLERRKGKKIKDKAIYRDPVASSRKWKVKCFGLKWVVISILVTFPWSKRSFALPIFCALKSPEDHPKNLKRKTRSGIDIACQMLIVIRRWFPNLNFTIVGDGDYAKVKLCLMCKKLSMQLITRMRADARLHDHPEQSERGRKKKLGKRLKWPIDGWEKVCVNWYGGQIKELSVKAKNCFWLAGKRSEIIGLTAIWVNMRLDDPMILMSTDSNISVSEAIYLYIKRWNIEVTFRECRDYLGVETQRQWSDLAIARTTPLLFALYTLIVLIGNSIYKERGIQIEQTAWYRKTHLTFSDLLSAVRQEIGDVKKITNSLFNAEFLKSSSKKKKKKNTPPSSILVT
jgi:hypothetical protein